MAAQGPTIKIKGKEYDVERDFEWRELLTVEELSGVPLARDGALDSMGVIAAFFFVVLKRGDKSLTWEGFLDGKLSDYAAEDDPEPGPDENEAKPTAKRRPTKPSA